MGSSWGWRVRHPGSPQSVKRKEWPAGSMWGAREGRVVSSSSWTVDHLNPCFPPLARSMFVVPVARVTNLGVYWNHPGSVSKSKCPGHAPDKSESLELEPDISVLKVHECSVGSWIESHTRKKENRVSK